MKHRAVIGIEISLDEIRGACVRAAGSTVQLASVASAPTPSGAFDAEGLLNAHVVGDAVRRVCAELDPREHGVVLGITGCNLVARVMEVPPVPDAEIRPVLRGEMDHYRILPAGQSAFDFYKLPDLPERESAAQEEPVTRVLLMGAEERVVSSYRTVSDAASVDMLALEPGSIAVLRALFPMLRAQEAVATVILSATGTDIFITRRGDLQFYRRVDTGVPELHVRIAGAEQTSLSGPGRGGLLVSDEPEPEPVDEPEPFGFMVAPLGESPAPPEPTEPDTLNRQAISLLVTEIQRSIDYYLREFPPPDGTRMQVRFAIDSPDARALFGAICQYLRSDAEMASVADTVSVGPDAAAAINGPEGFRFTVATGLALREAGGDYAAAPALDLGVGDRVIVERRVAPRAMVASMVASGLIFMGTIAAAIVVGGFIAKAEQDLTQRQHELDALTKEHAARVEMLDRQRNLVAAIHLRDKPVKDAVDFLSAAVSRRACLTTLAIQSDGAIQISGEAQAPRTVADIMDTINVSPVLEPIRLNNLSRIVDGTVDKGVHFDMQSGFLKPTKAASAAPGAATGGQGGG